MSTSSSKSFSVVSFTFSFSSLTASPTSTTEIKDFKEFNEEFRLTNRRKGFPPPATRLHQAGVLTAQDTEDI